MEFFHLRAGEEFIRLGQVLKAAGFVENGGQAKEVIQDGFVSVNGEVETRRGRKLYPNDIDYMTFYVLEILLREKEVLIS